jgi:hypothetical protein
MICVVARRSAPTVFEYCVGQLGVMRGARLAGFIVCWSITSAQQGRAITVEEYAEDWNENERTAYRRLAEFRQLFPAWDTPQVIADTVHEQKRDAAAAGALPMAAFAHA